jgi:hypothetical protein
LNNLHVTDRVNIALDVDDFSVIKGANNLEDAVNGTNVRQKGVAKASASGCSLCDDSGRNY